MGLLKVRLSESIPRVRMSRWFPVFWGHFMMRKVFLVISTAALFWVPNVWARFAEREYEYINCAYPSLIVHTTNPSDFRSFYSVPSEASCIRIKQNFSDLSRVTKQQRTTSEAFPSYEEVWRGFTEKTTAAQLQFGFATAVNIPSGRSEPLGLHTDFKAVEGELRRRLKIDVGGFYSGQFPIGSCLRFPSSFSEKRKSFSFNSPEDWREALSLTGYDCTARIFREIVQERNGVSGLSQVQTSFRQALTEDSSSVKKALNGFLKNRAVILVPQLGYDLPDGPFVAGTEKLKISHIEAYLSGSGARFYVARRNTLAHLRAQVATTKEEIKSILQREAAIQKTRDPKVLYLSRSMGALVLRLSLEEDPVIRRAAAGVLMMGATPWGSTVAEYKSRMDQFDEIFSLLTNPMTVIGGVIGGIFDPKLRIVIEAAKHRENVASMSYRGFEPKTSELSVPTMNVVLLPPNLKQYFNGSRKIPPVDETFFQMVMYGPTEGSAPLWGATWDTKRSATVVYDRLNHLAFWELDIEEALQLWGSALVSAFDQRLFR
jgi:hypothetical protein